MLSGLLFYFSNNMKYTSYVLFPSFSEYNRVVKGIYNFVQGPQLSHFRTWYVTEKEISFSIIVIYSW